jgi:hypothetical protein
MEMIHQVSIAQDIRAQAAMPAYSELTFELRRLASGQTEVVIEPVDAPACALRTALQKVRGGANAAQLKGMSAGEFMRFLTA